MSKERQRLLPVGLINKVHFDLFQPLLSEAKAVPIFFAAEYNGIDFTAAKVIVKQLTFRIFADQLEQLISLCFGNGLAAEKALFGQLFRIMTRHRLNLHVGIAKAQFSLHRYLKFEGFSFLIQEYLSLVDHPLLVFDPFHNEEGMLILCSYAPAIPPNALPLSQAISTR